MFTEQNHNYAGAKPGTTANTFSPGGKVRHAHDDPEYDEGKLRSYYLQRYRRKLKEAKKNDNTIGKKFFKAGLRYWKNRNKNLPDHLRRKADVVNKAIELAGGKQNFKQAVGLCYSNKFVDYMLDYRLLGRDPKEINNVYLKAHDWLMKNHPEEIT